MRAAETILESSEHLVVVQGQSGRKVRQPKREKAPPSGTTDEITVLNVVVEDDEVHRAAAAKMGVPRKRPTGTLDRGGRVRLAERRVLTLDRDDWSQRNGPERWQPENIK